jgi:hypothetical protein
MAHSTADTRKRLGRLVVDLAIRSVQDKDRYDWVWIGIDGYRYTDTPYVLGKYSVLVQDTEHGERLALVLRKRRITITYAWYRSIISASSQY